LSFLSDFRPWKAEIVDINMGMAMVMVVVMVFPVETMGKKHQWVRQSRSCDPYGSHGPANIQQSNNALPQRAATQMDFIIVLMSLGGVLDRAKAKGQQTMLNSA
jgi:hypothetical protein